MKKAILSLVFIGSLFSFNASSQIKIPEQIVQATIDLNTIKDDKVSVTITPPKFSTEVVLYHLPKIVPGTYSEDNYGKYIDNLKAYTKKGEAVAVTKIDDNSWQIGNAKKVTTITYSVNDTFDTEAGDGFGKTDIFSPAGSNIEEGKNIVLNTHCFIGYFSDVSDEMDYKVTIVHPATLWGATSMTDLDPSNTSDVFTTNRYAELVENPIMYAKPDFTTFNINGMDILIAVYSPNGIHTAKSLTPELKKMMTAQKNFLGTFNATKKYSVLIYLSDVEKDDAKGFGALEHPTATTVVMPEAMPQEELSEQLKDVVSHEFFHIVTPLTIHSKEIQFFDYTTPKMSEHLWMYEGVTEYFANLFQINQGLISEEEFYNRMSGKIANAKELNDTMSFTKMSANVLNQPYKDQYLNVYEKGALIGMCLDIIIREKSNGQRGILDLMQKLSNEYGANKPFNDNELFDKITAFTYPEVGTFLNTYVAGETTIPYETFFAKVGVTKINVKVPGNVFLKDKTPYITVNQESKEIIILPNIELNNFFNELGLKGGDTILAINDINYNLENIYDMLTLSESWKNDDPIIIKIKRNGVEQIVKGKTKLTFEDKDGYEATDANKTKLREAWLKG